VPEGRTADDVAFLERVLPPPPARVLDVACGLGRHMQALAGRGYDCVGIELNNEIASEARDSGLDVRTLDMRDLHEVEGAFDAVISMWASFAYFDDDANADVLAQMAGKLSPGGVLVLDLQNPAFYATRQGTHELRQGVVETKRVIGRRLVVEHDDGARFDWRLYDPAELAGLLEGLTLELVDAPGDSPRQRLVFRR
jgi:SAM-dependent methyltransferase